MLRMIFFFLFLASFLAPGCGGEEYTCEEACRRAEELCNETYEGCVEECEEDLAEGDVTQEDIDCVMEAEACDDLDECN